MQKYEKKKAIESLCKKTVDFQSTPWYNEIQENTFSMFGKEMKRMDHTIQRVDPAILSVQGLGELPKDLLIPDSPLKTYCLLYAIGGSFEVLWEQNRVSVSESCAFLFLPGACYTVSSASKTLHLIDIRFKFFPQNTSITQKMMDAPAQAILFSDYEMLNTPTMLTLSPGSQRNLEDILWEYPKKPLFAQEICNLYLKATLLALIRDSVSSNESNLSEAAVKIMRYVHEHITESLQNDIAAKELSYHPNYINRVIKKATGMTFHKYVVDEKLHYAATLLLSTNDSITEIAYSLAFNTSSHFSNLFAEKYQCTPSEYRKRRF